MPGHLQRSVECRRDWHRFQWISILAVFPITGIFVNKINNFRRATSWRVLVLNRHPARRGTSPVVTEGRDRDRSSLKIERIIKSRLGDSGSVPSWSSFCKIALGARRVRFVARMLKASATGSFCETELGQNRLSHISVHTVYRRPITIKPQPGAARFVTREFTNQSDLARFVNLPLARQKSSFQTPPHPCADFRFFPFATTRSTIANCSFRSSGSTRSSVTRTLSPIENSRRVRCPTIFRTFS